MLFDLPIEVDSRRPACKRSGNNLGAVLMGMIRLRIGVPVQEVLTVPVG